MADKNFRVKNGLETPLVAGSDGTTAITLSGSGNAAVAGNLTVSGGTINGPSGAADLIIQNASTIQIKNDFTLFSTDAGVTEAYFNLTGGKFTFNGADTDNTNNYNLYSHGTLGSLTDTTVGGTLYLKGSTSGSVGLKGAAAAGSTTYTFPSSDGSSGQVLSTNGSGTLSWATASGGGGTSLPAVKSESLSGQPWSTLPGCVILGSIGNSITTAAQSLRYHPFYVSAPITLTEVALQVSTATSLVSCNAMIFIVDVTPSTTGWQPSANRSGGYCGEITSITTTGIKSITGLSISLPAGAYLMAVQYSNFTGTLQCRSIPNQVITGNGYCFATSDGTTYAMNRTGVTYVSGTPAAAANWTNGAYGNAGHPGVVWAKWTVN